MGENIIPSNIFLSYARSDDEPFARQLYTDLIANGFSVWFDRVSMPSRGLTFLQEIRDAIDACERLILVVGPGALQSDYVQAEWQYALETCKVVTPVLRLGEYTQLAEGLALSHCPDMRPNLPYAEALTELLRILEQPILPLGKLFGVPSLPKNFLQRSNDLEALRDLVLVDVMRPTVITSAKQTLLLQGMGGVGKSVLAAAFARSCEARRTFRDGIIWLKINQEPALLTEIQKAAQALGGDKRDYYDLDLAWEPLGKLLANKTCLLVLDDVWDVHHAEKFTAALSPGGRILITTRDGGLASSLGAAVHRLDMLGKYPSYEKHYNELAVFPKNAAIPEAAVVQFRTHTNGLDGPNARKLLVKLDKKALLRLEGEEPYSLVRVMSPD